MKYLVVPIILLSIHNLVFGNFSPELLQLQKDIKELVNERKQIIEAKDKQFKTLTAKNDAKIDKIQAKRRDLQIKSEEQLNKIESYLPEIKKEFGTMCTDTVVGTCEYKDFDSQKSKCFDCGNLILGLFMSLVAPTQGETPSAAHITMFKELNKPMVYKYLLPKLGTMISGEGRGLSPEQGYKEAKEQLDRLYEEMENMENKQNSK